MYAIRKAAVEDIFLGTLDMLQLVVVSYVYIEEEQVMMLLSNCFNIIYICFHHTSYFYRHFSDPVFRKTCESVYSDFWNSTFEEEFLFP